MIQDNVVLENPWLFVALIAVLLILADRYYQWRDGIERWNEYFDSIRGDSIRRLTTEWWRDKGRINRIIK